MRGFLIILAAVLVAIGIGIAAEAAAGPTGPPPARTSMGTAPATSAPALWIADAV